jgi:hypothetical protein
MTRQHCLSRCAGAAAVLLASISCGDAVREGRSSVYLVIDTLQAATGNKPTQFTGGALLSDVVTIITTGGLCSATSPCPTIFDDFGQATFRTPMKNVTNPSSPNAPTTNNEVTITRYHVTFRRADGRNTPGVDVPYGFDGAVTGTVPLGGSLTLAFELVRHVAKEEAPLVQLRTNASIITTLAEITFYGRDRVGNDISATGTMSVNFGNFADP